MNVARFPVNEHDKYHAHVYFDQDTVTFATMLCEKAANLFGLAVGRVHHRNIGPHPKWSCQIAFTSDDFDILIPWLERERNGLTIFVHGITGDNLKDHTEMAYWLGKTEELNLAIFKTDSSLEVVGS
ncbi:4,5-dioxygenase [Psychromonas sp. B3M02]|uniref:DOPA 4,5-dioxygenase family protein n=2 Tax=unclassified Psychromonas TaxID=2614957 RepID=UPI000DEB5379|nr:DOPA 4,5-dioxygenase family protein [Psychromonas sp. B3M02]RBW46392.1 4,5-dioxygenase [Psychromonas sp. B3M02]